MPEKLADNDTLEAKQLSWQCRRGMRELDVLLSTYFEQSYPASSEENKAAFRRLLELSDPDLNGYLLGGIQAADVNIARVVAHIRGKASA